MADHTAKHESMKAKAKLEFEKLGAIGLYLFLTLTALEIYKYYTVRGFEVVNFKAGYNLFEALILAKVILLGDLMHLGEKFRRYPAAVPAIAKAFIFALFAALFSILETLVEKLIHGDGVSLAIQAVVAKDKGQLAIETLVVFLLFIPLFAMWEVARDVGEEKFIRRFFTTQPLA